MKALIRNEGETITQDMKVAGINWDTGAPLTNSAWCGGPYILVNDYIPDTPDEDFAEVPETAEDEETVTINGKEYTVEEARKILGVKL